MPGWIKGKNLMDKCSRCKKNFIVRDDMGKGANIKIWNPAWQMPTGIIGCSSISLCIPCKEYILKFLKKELGEQK